MTAVGVTATLVAVVPEWLLAPWGPIGERSYGIFGSASFVPFYEFERFVQPALVTLASVCCAVSIRGLPARTGAAFARHRPRGRVILASGMAAGYVTSFSLYYSFDLVGRLSFDLAASMVAEVGPLLLMAVCWTVAIPASEDRDREGNRWWSPQLAGLAFGVGGWCLLTRVVPTRGMLPWLYVAFVALSVAGLVVLAVCRIRFGDSVDLSGPPSVRGVIMTAPGARVDDGLVRARLSSFFLAPRELEVACAYLSGKTSAEVAGDLGIRPATVRTTMQRVYKKARVSSRGELAERVGDSVSGLGRRYSSGSAGPIARGASTGGDGRGVGAGNRPMVMASPRVFVILLCAGVLPVGFAGGPWGVARPFVYGCSLAIVASALVVASEGLVRPGSLSGVSRTVGRSFPSLVGLLAVLASSCLGVRMRLVDASVTLALAAFGILLFCLPVRPRAPSRPHWRAKGMSLGRDLLLCLVLPALWGVIGFSWEELWRGTIWYSLCGELAVFHVTCVAAQVVVCAAFGRQRHRAVLLGVCAVLSLATGMHVALFVGATCCLLSATRRAHSLGYVDAACGAWSCVSCGLGALFGDWLVNAAGLCLVGNDAYTALFGGRQAFGVVTSGLTVTVGILLGLCFALVLLRLEADEEASRLLGGGGDPSSRLRHVLLGRGLSETQVEVTLDILAARTSAEIAGIHHYSRGAVNSARNAAYKALGVHGRRELVDVLRRLSGL